MTEVTFFQKKNGSLTGFVVEGHAGYAEEGPDILCSAVSVLVMNTINSINELTSSEVKAEVDEDAAVIKAVFSKGPCRSAQLLLRSLALGLSNLEDDENYRDYIDVIFEEV